MNISRNWLKEFVDIEATDREYDEIMTIAGQKVETTTRMDAEIKNVVVGKVLSMARHDESERENDRLLPAVFNAASVLYLLRSFCRPLK